MPLKLTNLKENADRKQATHLRDHFRGYNGLFASFSLLVRSDNQVFLF